MSVGLKRALWVGLVVILALMVLALVWIGLMALPWVVWALGIGY